MNVIITINIFCPVLQLQQVHLQQHREPHLPFDWDRSLRLFSYWDWDWQLSSNLYLRRRLFSRPFQILSFIFRTKSIMKIIFRSVSIATVTVWLKPILTTFFRSKSRSVKTAWSTFSFTFINSDLLNSYPIRRRHCPNRVLSIYFGIYYCVYLSKVVWLWSKVLKSWSNVFR